MTVKKTTESKKKAVIPDILPVSGEQTLSDDTILVVTREVAVTRGSSGAQPLEVEKLTMNVNLFVQKMGKVLESTPEKLGKFHFDEFEVHAEVSADGTIAILGSGVHTGISGGLRFVFRRSGNSL